MGLISASAEKGTLEMGFHVKVRIKITSKLTSNITSVLININVELLRGNLKLVCSL